MSSKVIAKIVLSEVRQHNNMATQKTLLVKVIDDEIMGYTLTNSLSRDRCAISDIQNTIVLPELLLDYSDVNDLMSDIKKALESGVLNIVSVKVYDN